VNTEIRFSSRSSDIRTAIFIALLAFSLPQTVVGQRSRGSKGICAMPIRSGTWQSARDWRDSTAYSARPSTIVGQIVTVDGQPLSFAQARLQDSLTARLASRRGAAANEAGYFHLDSVAPGSYFLRVSALGYQSQWHELRVAGAGSDTLCIRLRAMPVQLMPVSPTKRGSR
jgi:hypothetical protein